MRDPILESSLKTRLNTFIVTFLLLNKKVDKFWQCLETAASLFLFSCVAFLTEIFFKYRCRSQPVCAVRMFPQEMTLFGALVTVL